MQYSFEKRFWLFNIAVFQDFDQLFERVPLLFCQPDKTRLFRVFVNVSVFVNNVFVQTEVVVVVPVGNDNIEAKFLIFCPVDRIIDIYNLHKFFTNVSIVKIIKIAIFDDVSILKEFRINLFFKIINKVVDNVPFGFLITITELFNQSVVGIIIIKDFLCCRIVDFVTIINVNLKVIIPVVFFAPSVVFR